MKAGFPDITCGRCGGCGRVEMPEHMREVLQTLRRVGPSSGSDVHRARRVTYGVTVGATINTLNELVRLGLVTRTGYARHLRFEAVR